MAQYEVTLRDYWRILRRRKGIVVFTAFLLGFFSFLLASVWKPQPLFQATAKVQINFHQNLTGLYLQTIAYNSGDQIETQQTIITSQPVLRRTGTELNLMDWTKTGADSAQVLQDLQRIITTSQEGFTNIITVSAKHPAPERARDMANTLCRVYRDYNHELKNIQAVRHREFVERQRANARTVLAQAEEAVRSYREDSELISLESQASVNLQGITTSEREVQRLRQDLNAITTMVSEMESSGGLSERTMQGNSVRRVGETFMTLSRNLNVQRQQREALLVQLTADHPNVRRVQVKIDQITRDLSGELRHRREAMRLDLNSEEARLLELREQYNLLPSRGLELSRLLREVAMRQEVVTVLEESYQEALIREADKVEEVSVLEWALTPSVPINPHHPLRRAVMGVLLGLVLGVVFAVVAETLDTSIGTIEDVQEYTGTQVVGIVPYINVDDVRASLARRGVDVSDDRTVQRKAQLVAYFDPMSTLAETYRTLRTNIEFVSVEKGVRCMMITSSMHHEGKSTTIANLAMTMAQLGKRTVLVDCDLRKPSTARLFGLDKEPGVTEVIVGNYKWQDVVRTVTDIVTGGMGMEDVLQTQGISNLNIITSGAIPPNPAELLNSRRMDEFLQELRDEYDVVLIDTPPVLHVTDAAILGKKVDGALMVYKAGDVARTSLKRSTSLLLGVGVELLGVVINGIRADLSSEYQDLGYNAYYAYGSDVAAPERTFEQKYKDLNRRWRKKLGLGDDQEELRAPAIEALGEDVEDPEEDHLEEPSQAYSDIDFEEEDGSRLWRRLVGYLALAVAAVGLSWQSGILTNLMPSGDTPDSPSVDVMLPATALRDESIARRMPRVAQPVPTQADLNPTVAISPASDEVRQNGAPPIATPLADAPLFEVVEATDAFVIRVAAYPPGSVWADRSLQALVSEGEPAFVSPVHVKGERYLRLLVGRFSDWDSAFGYAQDLRSRSLIEEFTVLRLPYAVRGDGVRPTDYTTDAPLLAGAFATVAEAERFVADPDVWPR
ncbi:MAG: polysaccharide biosynthesis tyrosine autokinase [Gemmatimonadetes bacterium]|jgi:capsular exopolysaccharide synthesis family protein|nr:polysaccharide biosynthesis tyrosine autokinase [Gemmatimonadota bacterium]MBT7859689.1 polysaccharide biosynthesis tyrosine autokinase [Gemmatimonadota bacterium]